ncbi:TPA: hypothetical protein ACHTMS_006710, partial [Pseudomonas aeruginosa]
MPLKKSSGSPRSSPTPSACLTIRPIPQELDSDSSTDVDAPEEPADIEDEEEATLFDHQDHLLEGRSEADVLYELLLKLGLDLCVPIEKRGIEGLDVHAVGG